MAASTDALCARRCGGGRRAGPDITCRTAAARRRSTSGRPRSGPSVAYVPACAGRALFLGGDEPLKGLAAAEYQHPLDANSLRALQVPGFDRRPEWADGAGLDRGSAPVMSSANPGAARTSSPSSARLLDVPPHAPRPRAPPVTAHLDASVRVFKAMDTGGEERGGPCIHSYLTRMST